MREYLLEGDYIELIKLLKVLRISESGGQAKMMVDDGLVKRNGLTEYRKRAKIRVGDTISLLGQTILIKEKSR